MNIKYIYILIGFQSHIEKIKYFSNIYITNFHIS